MLTRLVSQPGNYDQAVPEQDQSCLLWFPAHGHPCWQPERTEALLHGSLYSIFRNMPVPLFPFDFLLVLGRMKPCLFLKRFSPKELLHALRVRFTLELVFDIVTDFI